MNIMREVGALEKKLAKAEARLESAQAERDAIKAAVVALKQIAPQASEATR